MNDVPTHKPGATVKTLDRSPDAVARARFYKSKEWRRVRATHIVRQPWCVPCLARGELVPAAAVHHLETIEDRPDRALDLSNLQSICKPCHSARHAKKEAPK